MTESTAIEAHRKAVAAHRRIDESREEAHQMEVRLGGRIATLEDRGRIKFSHVLGLIGILSAVGTVMVFAFWTRSEGVDTRSRLTAAEQSLTSHVSDQQERNARTVQRLDRQESLLKTVSDNVIRIGTRVGAKMEEDDGE